MQKRKVNLAVCGKFHYLNYAKFLNQAEVLNSIYFSHKASSAEANDLPADRSVNHPLKEYLVQGQARVLGPRSAERTYGLYSALWNLQALADWRPAPVLHFLANGSCGPLMRRARSDGATVLADVVNTHPENRLQRLRQEAERWRCQLAVNQLRRRELRTIDEIQTADLALVPSETVRRTLVERGLTKPIFKIPYAANLARFYPREDYETPLPATGSLRVISVGQIGLRKGQLYLLEAIRRMGPGKVDLTLVGTIAPEVEDVLRDYADLFTHIERVDSGKMRDLLLRHDVFVLASVEEGLAVSICEAMATGLAVVATRESGAEELIDADTGIIIEAQSVGELQDALTSLLDQPERRHEIARSAVEISRTRSNWGTYAKDLIKLYGTL